MYTLYYVETNGGDEVWSWSDDENDEKIVRLFDEYYFPREWDHMTPVEVLETIEDDSSWEEYIYDNENEDDEDDFDYLIHIEHDRGESFEDYLDRGDYNYPEDRRTFAVKYGDNPAEPRHIEEWPEERRSKWLKQHLRVDRKEIYNAYDYDMRSSWEFENGIFVYEDENIYFDCNLYCFDVYKTVSSDLDELVFLGSIYPRNKEEREQCVILFDEGQDPVSGKWEDEKGKPCIQISVGWEIDEKGPKLEDDEEEL